MFAGRGVSADARFLGEMTISMLQGESGVLRKEFDKLVDWTKDEPVPDVVNLPNSLLISMAAPLKRALERPVCVTLQGEELFIDALVPPYREQALHLIRRQVRDVDRFIAVSDYCARFMSSFLEIPSDRIVGRPARDRMDGYARPEPRAISGSSRSVSAIWRESHQRRACACWRRPTCGCVRACSGAPARLEVAGYMAPEQRSYLDERSRGAGAGGTAGRDDLSRRNRSRREACVPARARRPLGARDYDEPKGMFLLEAMASGVPVVQPRRGAFIEVVGQDGRRHCSSIRTIPTRSRADCIRCGRILPYASGSAARRSRACARTTRSRTRRTV